MREALYDFCIANRKETLLSQWDCEKHAPLGPSNVSQGSHERVFWRCENNHVWNAAVYARTKAVLNVQGFGTIAADDVGKTAFLSLEEAERALEEQKNV